MNSLLYTKEEFLADMNQGLMGIKHKAEVRTSELIYGILRDIGWSLKDLADERELFSHTEYESEVFPKEQMAELERSSPFLTDFRTTLHTLVDYAFEELLGRLYLERALQNAIYRTLEKHSDTPTPVVQWDVEKQEVYLEFEDRSKEYLEEIRQYFAFAHRSFSKSNALLHCEKELKTQTVLRSEYVTVTEEKHYVKEDALQHIDWFHEYYTALHHGHTIPKDPRISKELCTQLYARGYAYGSKQVRYKCMPYARKRAAAYDYADDFYEGALHGLKEAFVWLDRAAQTESEHNNQSITPTI